MRFLTLSVIACAIFAFVSCADPEPAEIGVNCKYNGKGQSCAMVLFNSKGVQIQVENTDYYGIGYFKQVKPGKYTVKFLSGDDTYYPAERAVDVSAGSSEYLDVELSQGPDSASGS